MTETFYFASAGISLFLNTFGWDIVGSILVSNISILSNRKEVWLWFTFYQILETVGSCISVTWMRRNLMLWSIFAPRFVFAAVFLMIGMVCNVLGCRLLDDKNTLVMMKLSCHLIPILCLCTSETKRGKLSIIYPVVSLYGLLELRCNSIVLGERWK